MMVFTGSAQVARGCSTLLPQLLQAAHGLTTVCVTFKNVFDPALLQLFPLSLFFFLREGAALRCFPAVVSTVARYPACA